MQGQDPIVLDAHGNTLYSPPSSETRSRAEIRVYRGSWWLPLALGLGVPFLLVAGIFVFTVLMTLGLLVLFLRGFLGFGKPLGSR